MQVCKTYLKIVWRRKTELLIYLIVFVSMGIGFSATSKGGAPTDFENVRTPIAFYAQDMDAPLIAGLRQHLEGSVEFIDMPDDEHKIADALFARSVEYVLRAPDDFEARFFAGEDVALSRTSVPGSYTALYVDSQVDQYLNTARVYRDSAPNMDRAQLLANVRDDLAAQAKVSFSHANAPTQRTDTAGVLLNMMCYSSLAMLILGVCSAMMALQKTDVRQRNQASPISFRSYHFQLVLGNLLLALIVWIAQMAAAFALFGDVMTSRVGPLLMLNGLLMCLVALSISYFFAGFIKSRGAMSGATNVVSLGMAFISGAFVPQALISPAVLKAASFLPGYWFVKGNQDILGLQDLSAQSLSGIAPGLLILAGYAVAILSVSLVYNKYKRA